MIFRPLAGIQVYLSRQVGFGVGFLKHGQGRELGKAQIAGLVGIENTL